MKRNLLLLLSLLIASFGLIAQTDAEKNKALVLKMNDLFNRKQTDSAMNFFADSLTKTGQLNGKSFFRAMSDDIDQTFPDKQTNIVEMWTERDWVIARCNFTGTHKGMATLPHHGGLLIGKTPTNRRFSVEHIRMYKIQDNKIVARKAVRDDLLMYQQLGIIPAAPAFKPSKK